MSAPLLFKFRTKSETRYFLDAGTGRIIKIDEVIDEILDDYRLLTHDEVLEKYDSLGRHAVQTALNELDELRKDGYLADHQPQELAEIERIIYDGELHQLDRFWQETKCLLILGLTERCNLKCSYCCYGGGFAENRTHTDRTMPVEIAHQAITDFLDGTSGFDDEVYPISFYGGEPLLELDYLKELVAFADDLAAKQGKVTQYNLTTNATLLDDAATDYLVERGFNIMVSLDGPKNSHDRYRVFSDGTGSFDLVMRNLKRFVERYPDYSSRSINMVLAAPLDLDAADAVMREFFPYFPTSRASLVNVGRDFRFTGQPDVTTRYGCHEGGCSGAELPLDAFRDYSAGDADQIVRYWNDLIESLARDGFNATRKNKVLATMLFGTQIRTFHRCGVTSRKPDWRVMMQCLPGFARLFCDVDGKYRPCERVDDSEMLVLGNALTGLDVEKMRRVMELRRQLGDCGNCVSVRTCSLCFARIPNTDRCESGYDNDHERQCDQVRQSMIQTARAYMDVMERNPNAFDTEPAKRTRMDSIGAGVVVRPVPQEILERIRCEKRR